MAEHKVPHTVPDYIRNIGPVVASIRRDPFQDSYEWAVVCERPELPESRRYSTHRVAQYRWNADGRWVSVSPGNYDLSWTEALNDMRTR